MAGMGARAAGAKRAAGAAGARGAGLACGATQKVLRTKRFTRDKRAEGELGLALRENVESTQFADYPHHRELLRVTKADGEYLQGVPERFGNYWGKALPLPDNHPRTGNIVMACLMTVGLGAYLDFGGASSPSFTWGLLAVIFSLLAFDPKSGNTIPFYPYGGGLKFRKAATAPTGVTAGKKSGEAPPKLSTKKVRAPPAPAAAAAAPPAAEPAAAEPAAAEPAAEPAAEASDAGESDAEREARLAAVLDNVDAEAPAAAAGEAAAGGSDADVEDAKKWLEEALAEDGGEGEGEKKSGGFKLPWGKKD